MNKNEELPDKEEELCHQGQEYGELEIQALKYLAHITSIEPGALSREEREKIHKEGMSATEAWMNSILSCHDEEPRKIYEKSHAGIEEMRADECDPQEIEEAEARLAYHKRGLQLIPLIESAFAGVKLADGIGLLTGQALDGYEDDPEVLERCAREDEREDWSKITSEALNRCDSSMSFFDAEGMRFHLPAFIIAELKGESQGLGMEIRLTNISDYSKDQYTLLNATQRNVTRTFLLHLLEDPDRINRDSLIRPIPEGEEYAWLREYLTRPTCSDRLRTALAEYWLPADTDALLAPCF